VINEDIYASPDEDPATIDLDSLATGPNGLLFYNPALVGGALNALRFVRRNRTVPLSVVAFVPEGGVVMEWQFPEAVGCGASGFEPRFGNSPPPDSMVLALRNLPDSSFTVSVFGQPDLFRYGLRVSEGYQLADPRIEPDRWEENDFCQGADSNFVRDPIILETAFTDTLTIDNPMDDDWIKFRVPGPGLQLVTARTEARPFGAADSSDLALSVLRSSLDARAPSDHPGTSQELLAVDLPPGDYYLVITDQALVPTRYSLCITLGSTCALP
jgi:hypothetical protein